MSGIRKKIVFLPYDFDTALGIDNYGRLRFDYHLEDIDTVNGEKVYAGQDSVLWKNVRAAFADELASMWKTLRSGNDPALSYNKVEAMFKAHQDKWPEALANEDYWYKYILPLIQNNENRLEMCLGLKTEQRKWWLYNRFKYIDSKYNAGDASADSVSMRTYYEPAESETYGITVTPYADIYATVMYGVSKSSVRSPRNQAVLVPCALSHLEFTDTYIYSASQIKSFGDLSIFWPDAVEFSRATHIQELKLGDSSNSYTNPNLKALSLGNNVLLKKIDCRNCVNMGTGSQKTVDLSGCSNIEEVYFDGTAIGSTTLPNGGFLKKLHLPSTITNLTVLNQKNITEFICPGFTNVTTFRIENCSSVINTKSIVQAIPAATRLRLVGFAWECDDAEEIESLLDIFDTMRGLDEQGNTISIADGGCRTSISGMIHTDSLTGAQIASYQARYPYLSVTADHTSAQLKFYNGTTLLTTQTVLDGGDGTYSGSTPTKTADAQYTYTFAGWSKDTDDNTVDSDALTHVSGDRNVYACYTGTLQKYSVTFVRASADGGGTLQTVQNIDYGTVVTAANLYSGATPTTTQGDATDYPFEGWNPPTATVTGNTTFTAKFGSPIDVSEITDDWDTIIQHIDAGDYATRYKIGQYKPLDLGTEGTVNMQIVGIDVDKPTKDSDVTIPLSFIAIELLNKYKVSASEAWWGTNGCQKRLETYIWDLIPQNVRSRIIGAYKYYGYNKQPVQYGGTIKIWIPSVQEVIREKYSTFNSPNPKYAVYSGNSENLIKHVTGESTFSRWRLRDTVDTGNNSAAINESGVLVQRAYGDTGTCLGFCLGLEQEIITDSWETILSNPNYATDYSIGDTKSITINGEQHLMQIVAFDTDDKTAGGKAKISWLMKDLTNEKHRMNATATNENGWPATEMRSWLRETILPTIDSTIRSHIVDVDKTYYDYTTKSTLTSSDNVWLASAKEMFGGTSYESSGPDYTTLFKDNTSRIKKHSGAASYYSTRTANSNYADSFRSVSGSGNASNSNANTANWVCLGFCTD